MPIFHRAFILVLIAAMTPNSLTTNAFSTATSQNAKIMAQNFEAFQMKKLQEAGLLGLKRPFTIVAEAVGASAEKSMRSSNGGEDCLATKIVHFQRHGQGYHNLIGEIYRETRNAGFNLDELDPKMNPYLRPEILDSPLTEKGRLECASKRSEAALLNPQVILVSPLHRAIQTALLTFADHRNDGTPWVAHEGAREQMGLLQCNKRRALSQTKEEFPFVDFSQMESGGDEDTLWDPTRRESPKDETERIYSFLTEFLMHRPEDELALVGHSAWLFTMCNAVVDCGDDDSLRALFKTSEIRSIRLSFYKTKDQTVQ